MSTVWVALMVAVGMNGQVITQTAPEPYKTEAECKAINKRVQEEMLPQVEGLKAVGLTCAKLEVKDYIQPSETKKK